MICFRDKTFCSQKSCQNHECDRRITEVIGSAAMKCGLPIAMADFKDTDMCPGYVAPCQDNVDEARGSNHAVQDM